MVLVGVVGWMLDVFIVVGLLVMVCACDDPRVVGWLCPGHSVLGGLGFWTIPCWVRAVLAVKQAVKSAQLLCPSTAPPSDAVVMALGGIPDDGRSLRLDADWRCCAPIGDYGCLGRSLAAVA
jgi:hypothetical protein